ncbi:signal peptidase II [Pseudonocardia sp. DLS-67]
MEQQAATATRAQRWTRGAPWIAVGLALVVLAVDQLSKLWATTNLTEGERLPLLGDALGIKLIYNPGAAFSIGAGSTWIFTIVAAGAVVAGGCYAWQVRSRPWAVCIGLLLGGAVTHLLDRLFRAPSFGQGHVVDFIAYFDWFIGNVADIALFAGGVLLLVLSWLGFTLRPAAPAE